MRLFTIGFTQKTARRFFDLLRTVGVGRVLDTRLHTVASRLSIFSVTSSVWKLCTWLDTPVNDARLARR